MIRVLVLYASIADYTLGCIEELCLKGIIVELVRYPILSEAPFEENLPKNLGIYDRLSFKKGELLSFAKKLNPQIVLVSGWVDKEYLEIGNFFKQKSTPVIMALDNPWDGKIRQRIGVIIFRAIYIKCFTHVFVAGYRQYEFARQLGFQYSQTLFNVYSARTAFFENSEIGVRYRQQKSKKKKLLYIGRLIEYKGILDLYNCFLALEKEIGDQLEWELDVYGNGELQLEDSSHIKFKGFIQPSDIPSILESAQAFCLPSYNESWGVAVHEFASAGMVMLVSEGVSAKEQFVINNFNGIVFKNKDLKHALKKLFNYGDEELIRMSKNSRLLSQRITPATWSATLLSVLN